MLTQDWFSRQLAKASLATHKFTGTLVTQTLPGTFLYFIRPNQSFDKNSTNPSIDLYPGEEMRLKEGKTGTFSHQQVVEWCVRNEKVPEWIDISVESASDKATLFQLKCCGRFSPDPKEAYDCYQDEKSIQPFGIKPPTSPPGWPDKKKFDLHWCSRVKP